MPASRANTIANYVPADRRQALATGKPLAEKPLGAALLADLAGFTPVTETIVRLLGPHRGAEALLAILNPIYEVLMAEVDRYGGSVVTFGGDAIIAWFEAETEEALVEAGRRAVACALAMQAASNSFESIVLPGNQILTLALKTAVATGPVRRMLVGDPAIQTLEMVAGATIVRLAEAASLTGARRVMLDTQARRLLGEGVVLADENAIDQHKTGYAVRGLKQPVEPRPWPALREEQLKDEAFRPWLLRPVYERLHSGQGEFLTELRHTLSLFLQFNSLDYDHDEQASAKLDAFVRWAQLVLSRYEGTLLQVLHEDKGNYLYAVFGAPVAHGDDTVRALAAALELSRPPARFAHMGPMKIGISGGLSWAGVVGGSTRTYGVMGDATNLAARLMQAGVMGEIWVSANLAPSVSRRYTLEPLPPIRVRGKVAPVPIMLLRGELLSQATRLPEPQSALPLIGREVEVAALEEKIRLVSERQGQVVNVIGEAGIGKSRLAAEVIELAKAAGCVCLASAAQATDVQAAYFAWQPVWRAFFGLEAGDSAERQIATLSRALIALDPKLLPRLPLLGSVTGLSIPENDLTRNLEARLRKESLEGLLVDCLQTRLAVHDPERALLLILEDAHWLDDLSIDLLGTLGRAIRDLPVLILLTYRSGGPKPPNPLTLTDLPYYTELTLEDLTPSAAAQLIEQRAALALGAQNRPTTAFVQAIRERAEGNPFYIEELINYLGGRGLATNDMAALARLELPSGLTSLTLSRIDQLSTSQQTVLKVASVIGRSFRFEWLWGVYPSLGSAETVRQDLEALARQDITALDRPEPELSYLFRHALIQEVAYSSMPQARVRQLHEQLASWLEGRGEAALDLLAYHYGRSHNRAKQREYFRKAGDAAAARYANEAAIQHYERLLAVLEAEEQPPVFLALARLETLTSAWDAAEAHYRAALTRAATDPLLQAWSQLGLGVMKRTLGLYREAEAWLEEAQNRFRAAGHEAGLIETLVELAFDYLFQGKTEAAQTLVEQSVRLAEQTGDQRLIARAVHMRGNVSYFKSDKDTACDDWRQSMDLRRQLNDKEGLADVVLNLAVIMFDTARYEEAQALMTEYLAICDEVGSRQSYVVGQQLLSLVLMNQGEVEAARMTQIATLALARDLQALQQIADGLLLLAWQTWFPEQTAAASQYALRLAAASYQLQASLGSTMVDFMRKRAEVVRTETRNYLGPTEAEAAWAAGQAMSWQEAVTYALEASQTLVTGVHS